jgi:hypothetical protein
MTRIGELLDHLPPSGERRAEQPRRQGDLGVRPPDPFVPVSVEGRAAPPRRRIQLHIVVHEQQELRGRVARTGVSCRRGAARR